MRLFIHLTLLAVITFTGFSCASHNSTKVDAKSAPQMTQTAPPGKTKACVMQFGGHDVLRLTIASDATCVAQDGSLFLKSSNDRVYIWLVSGAHTVDEAAAHVDRAIESEFKGFQATGTTPISVAGKPARRMIGSGTEADDGDPGEADVVVFIIGSQVFVACNHGESLHSHAQQWMLTLLQSAQVP